MKSPTTVAVAAALSLLCLTGCSSATADKPAPTSTSVTPTANPTEAAVESALSAYYGARTTIVEVEKAPKRTMAEYPAPLQAKMRQYLEGKALDNLLRATAGFAQTGYRLEEDVALSTPMVVKVDTVAGAVVLKHCPGDEKVTMVHGSQVSEVQPGPGEAPYPHLATYTMTRREGQWRLSNATSDGTKTCAPDTL